MPTVYHRVDFACFLSDISFTANNVEAAIKRLKSNLSNGPVVRSVMFEFSISSDLFGD